MKGGVKRQSQMSSVIRVTGSVGVYLQQSVELPNDNGFPLLLLDRQTVDL